VRLALGATPHDVRRLVRTTGLRLAAAGLAGGAVLAIGLGRMLAAVQYEVTLTDPAIWLTVVIVITATVFASTLRPSREAGRVDPLTLLRAE
jgi:ABC-type antimicrobial peptide transport system permease subunit